MAGQRELIKALKSGPKTAKELAEITYDESASVSRYMGKIIRSGRAERVDGKSGPGNYATYDLTPEYRKSL